MLLGRWFTMSGAFRVVAGDLAGWAELHKGIHSDALSFRIMVVANINYGVAYEVSLALAYALAVGDYELSRVMAECYCRSAERGLIATYSEIGFESFALWLYCEATNSTLHAPFAVPQWGDQYAPVIETWNDVDALKGVLERLCNVHRTYARDRAGFGYAQFHEPFDILPLEIVAMQRVRRHLGLAVPVVDHPLMASPLAAIPESPPEFRRHGAQEGKGQSAPLLRERESDCQCFVETPKGPRITVSMGLEL